MKRALLTGVALAALAQGALAADLQPYYKAPPPYAPAFTWGGAYIGGNAGYSWSTESVGLDTTGATSGQVRTGFTSPGTAIGTALATAMSGAVPSSVVTDPHGFIGGAQLGYNWQWGWWVAGLETDFQGADIKGSNSATGAGVGFIPITGLPIAGIPFNSTSSLFTEQKLDWFGTVRARLGFTLWDPHLLVYGTGGFAYGQAEADSNYSLTACALGGLVCSNSAIPAIQSRVTGPSVATGSASSTLTGWTAGAGVEYAFAPGWSLKTEWLHYDLGSLSYALSPSVVTFQSFSGNTHTTTASTTATTTFAGDIVRVGVNYKFW